MTELYNYKANVWRVVDGDTIVLNVDLGFRIRFEMKARLSRINAPEITGVAKDSEEYKAGMKCKARLESLVSGKDVSIKTLKDPQDKYGRYLVELFTADGFNVNELLVSEGLAKQYT